MKETYRLADSHPLWEKVKRAELVLQAIGLKLTIPEEGVTVRDPETDETALLQRTLTAHLGMPAEESWKLTQERET